MTTHTIIIEVELRAGAFIELNGATCRLWDNEDGSLNYEGPIQGLGESRPEVIEELLERKLIRRTEPK